MRYTDKIESAIEAEFYKNGRTMFWFSQFRDFAPPDELKVYFESMINTGRFVFIVDVYCEHCDEKVEGKEFRSSLKAKQYLTQGLEHLECRSCERTMTKGNYYLHVSYRLSESWIERLKGPPEKKPHSSGDMDVPELKNVPQKSYRDGKEAAQALFIFESGSNPIFNAAEQITAPGQGSGNTNVGRDNLGNVASGHGHKQNLNPKPDDSIAKEQLDEAKTQTNVTKFGIGVTVIVSLLIFVGGMFFEKTCATNTSKTDAVKAPKATK